jgi:hypothetical protein
MPVYNYTTLDDPLQVGFTTEADDINDAGQIVGTCRPAPRGGNIFESRANDSEELIMQTELKNSCDSPLLFQGK